MRPHLEPECNRFRPGWGAAFFSEPPGIDVKKRRKPKIQRGGVSTARGPPPKGQRCPAQPSGSSESRGRDPGIRVGW